MHYEGDIDNGITYLISPTIDLSGLSTAELSYARWFHQVNRNDGHDDFFSADVSDDNGETWTPLQTVTSLAYVWVLETYQLEEFIDLTDAVKLRFAAQAEEGAIPDDTVEAAVDEVVITTPESCSETNGDADANCTVDLADYAGWGDCMTGPDLGPYDAGCAVFNFDGNDDIDLKDLAQFVLVFGGERSANRGPATVLMRAALTGSRETR
ncbi:MAG: hypothetical protein ACYTFA_16425 [Planctomycetota bacterium]